MDYNHHIKIVMSQIKDGIDQFNAASPRLKADYPASIEIEYQGIKMTVPFIIVSIE